MAQQPARRPRRRSSGDRPPPQDPEIDLLAAEAVSLTVRACSSRAGVDALTRMADDDPEVLVAAAARCGSIADLGHAVQRQASELLRRAAADVRATGGSGGTIGTGQRGGS